MMNKKAFLGVGWCWNLYLSAAIGVSLVLFPYLFSFTGFMQTTDHLIGSLIVVVSILSLAEVIRSFRFVNMLFGAFIMVIAWMYSDVAIYHNLLGLALILLSIRRGKIRELYGSWQKMIK